MTVNVVTPYEEAELFADPDSGSRSLHYDANKFYKAVMHIKTPIAHGGLPTVENVVKVFDSLVPNEDVEVCKLVLNLQATKLQDLWPDATNPPITSHTGLIFHAAHEENAVISCSSVDFRDSKPEAKKKAHAVKKSINKGRPKNAFNWNDKEIQVLLDSMETHLPCGEKQWELVVLDYYNNFHHTRSTTSIKKKFDKMWQIKKPTGSAEIPVDGI